MDSAYTRGYNGYLLNSNKGKYNNPFKRATDDYNDFERGWTQALKRSPESTIQLTTSSEGRKSKSFSQKQSTTQLAAEAYANRK